VKRAVLYCRVSTKEQASNLSLPVQEKACREWCERAGAEVVRVFVDRGESAKTSHRPAFLEALEFCRRGDVSFFVVYALSRFARSTHDHAVVSHRLKGYGAELRSVTEPIDGSSSGRLMETILSGFAQFDNDVRAERTRAGMRAALERGRWTHRAPLGYLNGMELDPDRAPVIREAFSIAADWSGTIADLRRRVGALGLTARSVRPVPQNTFWRLLRNPVYAGVLRAPGLEARGAFEPLVELDTFHRVQARMAGRRPEGARRLKLNPEFPLRRFVRCGPCGHPLTGYFARGRHGGRFPYYRCRVCDGVSVRREILEGAFVELLNSAAVSAVELEAMRAAVAEETARLVGVAVESRGRKARRLEELRRKRARLMDGYLAGEVAAGAYQEAAAELEAALLLSAARGGRLAPALEHDVARALTQPRHAHSTIQARGEWDPTAEAEGSAISSELEGRWAPELEAVGSYRRSVDGG
jgi:site-specific DNA recombinase